MTKLVAAGAVLFGALLLVRPAGADELRDLCPSRPGLGTPSCIVDAGHLLVETSIGDWTRESNAESVTHRFQAGEFTLRYGLDARTELQFGLLSYGNNRERDRVTGDVQRSRGVGDVTLGLRHAFRDPDGESVSIAAQPFVTLPTGRATIGDGDWGAGIIVPVNIPLGGDVSLELSPEVDAAVDEDGDGRHLAFGSVIGLQMSLTEQVDLNLELSAFRDNDPAGHKTRVLAATSLAWQPTDNLQLDAGTMIGLNYDAPDVGVSLGIARRF